MAATNKFLAQNNKSRTGEATKTAVDAGDQPRRTRKSQKHKVNAALEMARNRNAPRTKLLPDETDDQNQVH